MVQQLAAACLESTTATFTKIRTRNAKRPNNSAAVRPLEKKRAQLEPSPKATENGTGVRIGTPLGAPNDQRDCGHHEVADGWGWGDGKLRGKKAPSQAIAIAARWEMLLMARF